MNVKKLEDEIRQLTILYSTAREEGDEEEHERVVKEIISFFSDIIREIVGEEIKEPKTKFQLGKAWEQAEIRQRAKKLGIKT